MTPEHQQLEATIAGLEAQRALLGDALVDAAVLSLRAKLAALVTDGSGVPQKDPSLRQVSVLFMDVVGSTLLSQNLDPEDIQRVMDHVLTRFTAIVESYQGRVLQYAGDSVLAAFGADETREDDAERAVRAGLAILEEARVQAERIAREFFHEGFNVRVGLNTGPVLLGGSVDEDKRIHGMTVNVAARMEQTAPAGGLRITHDTYRHVRGVFDVEAQPAMQVKGRDDPIVTYLVLGAKPRAFRVTPRGVEGIETRMVGRETELAQLQERFKQLYQQNRLTAVTVVAEAGIGKSRLLYEFENWAESRPERFIVFEGRAQGHTQTQPYGLMRDVLAWRLQIADSDSMSIAREKLLKELIPIFSGTGDEAAAEAHVHLLGHLIGLDFHDSPHLRGIIEDGKQIRNRAFHAGAQLFRRLALDRRRPVVLLLDDLHWADDGSLDFIHYVMRMNRDVPMLLLCLTRPSLFERRLDWTSVEQDDKRIDLEPLDRDRSRELAQVLLQKLEEIPAALRELIIGGAEGNPFYMEELVKMLIDEGAIVTTGQSWRVIPQKLLSTKVPQTLTGVLQARLDSLSATQKRALQQASVIGFIFWDQALAAIDPESTSALWAVTERELVVAHQEGVLEGAREYAFRHQILHQVTYDTLLKRTRREYHALAASWMSGITGVRANDLLGVTAEHYERAGDLANAAEYFARATENAASRYAHDALLSYAERALAIAPKGSHELRWRVVALRERSLDKQGKRKEQCTDIDTLEALAERFDDDTRRAEAAWRRADIALRTGDYRTQSVAAQRALRLAESAGAVALMLRSQLRYAQALMLLGDAGAAKTLAALGLERARALGQDDVAPLFINALGMIAQRQNDLVAALHYHEQDLVSCQACGDRAGEAASLNNVGSTWLRFGAFAPARLHLDASLRVAREIGDRAAETYILGNLAMLASQQEDYLLALAQAQAALEIAVSVEDTVNEASALFGLAQAELGLGRHASAQRAFEQARDVFLEADMPHRALDCMAGLARVTAASGDLAKARTHIDVLLGTIVDSSHLDRAEYPLWVRQTCFEVLQSQGDERATEILAAGHCELMRQADAISEPSLRESFLDQVPWHRAMRLAWSRYGDPLRV